MANKNFFRAGRKELITALCEIKDPKLMERFLTDMLTPQEFENLVERWLLIKLLLEGKPQREIRDELGVGIATVTRGSRQLKYGTGAFEEVIGQVLNHSQ